MVDLSGFFCRSDCALMQPFLRRRTGFSMPMPMRMPSAFGADCRSHRRIQKRPSRLRSGLNRVVQHQLNFPSQTIHLLCKRHQALHEKAGPSAHRIPKAVPRQQWAQFATPKTSSAAAWRHHHAGVLDRVKDVHTLGERYERRRRVRAQPC